MNDFDFFYSSCLTLTLVFALVLIFFSRSKRIKKLNKKVLVIYWNLFLTFFLIIFCFTSIETYYRFFVDTTDSFAINKISKRWIARHFEYNNLSMRDNINYYNKIAQGKRRITILGDSFTNGHGIKDVDDRFSNILRKKSSNLEVHIIADNGASTKSLYQMISKLNQIGYEFDIVLLAYCLNDIEYLLTETKKINKSVRAFNTKLNFLEKNSYFINQLSFRLFAKKNPHFMNYSNFVLDGYMNSNIWEQQKKNLIMIKKEVERSSGRLTVVTFPFLQQKINDYPFKDAHKRINGFWKDEGVPHLDLLPIYQPYMGSELTVNKYDAHPNELANQMAADAIMAFFSKMK